MANIVVSEFLTLDGVYQAPGGAEEDPSGGFTKGGWQMRFPDDGEGDENGGNEVLESFKQTEGLLLGRRTYDIFAAYWPNQPADDPFAAIMNGFDHYIVSTTLSEPLAWQNSTLIARDVPAAVNALRAKPGKDIQVIGSGVLVRTLIANDLVDRYRLMIYPIVLGEGKKLFPEGLPDTRLKLASSKTTKGGVLIVDYVPA